MYEESGSASPASSRLNLRHVARLMSHAIPFEPIEAEDYDAFLHARAKRSHDAMNALCDPEGTASRVDQAA